MTTYYKNIDAAAETVIVELVSADYKVLSPSQKLLRKKYRLWYRELKDFLKSTKEDILGSVVYTVLPKDKKLIISIVVAPKNYTSIYEEALELGIAAISVNVSSMFRIALDLNSIELFGGDSNKIVEKFGSLQNTITLYRGEN